jgi:putative transposase
MTDYTKRPPRLTRIFGNNPLYFVTFCSHRRSKVLATNSVDAGFLEFGSRAHAIHNVAVGRYVIMPDHLHLFVCGPDDFELGRWVGALKQHLAKAVGSTQPSRTIWQRGFFDHVLRSNESYGQKWSYVRENPVRAGLVEKAEDWPYQGDIVYIDRA